MFRRIVLIWKFLWKSREEKKTELAKPSLEVFKALAVKDLDSATKQKIYPYVKDLYNDLMEVNVLQFKVNFIAIPLVFLLLIITWFFVAGLIIGILYAFLSFFFSVNLNNVPQNIQPFLASHGFLGIVIGLLFYVLYIVGFFSWLGVSFNIAIFLLDPILSAYSRFFERLRNTRYPVASLVDKLIWLLHNAKRYQMNIEEAYRAIETAVLERELAVEALAPIDASEKKGEKEKEKPDSRMKELIGYKQQQMLLLEGAARCLERYVPRQLRGGDAITDYWLKETFQLAAAALREKKTWILTPKVDTYDNLTEKIASTLKCAIKDNWDALERVEMEELMKRQKLARSQLWRFRLLVLLRGAFVAILPVVGFIILQLTPLATAGATRTYVIVGLFIWVGLSVLALFDPDLEKKLGMANTIKSLLSLPGKDGP